MDARLYPGNSSVLFGIGPGEKSIVKRLYERKIISAPLLSVTVFKQQFQIGAEDNKNCLNDWHYFPSTSKSGWEFDVDVYFSPVGWFNNTKTSIAIHWPSVQIPLNALAHMASTWNLTYYYNFFVNMANCDGDFVLEYHFKNYSISVKLNDLGGWSENSNITACGLLMQAPDYLDPFTEHSSWTIALPFFNLYCFAFNYADNTMGIATKCQKQFAFFSSFSQQLRLTQQVYKIDLVPNKDNKDVYVLAVLNFTLGNQHFLASFHSLFDDLIVTDVSCGQISHTCPRYCKDMFFASYYCSPMCQITMQSRQILCTTIRNGRSFYYNSSLAPNFKPLLGDHYWRKQLMNTRPLIGKLGTDDLNIMTSNNLQLNVENFEFVSGYSMDTRLFPQTNALFGMALNENSLISRLYKLNKISAPVMSLALSKQSLVLGAQNNDACTSNWHTYSTSVDGQWILDARTVNVFGVGKYNNFKTLNRVEFPLLEVPINVINDLVHKNIIWFNNTLEYFCIDCSAKFQFDFNFGDKQTYTLDQNDLIVKANDSNCVTLISGLEDVPYTDVASWHLGTVFHRRYCHAFNFGDKTLSLAEYK
ncbi:hypothetical protein M3Y97_00007200 [Aphelenchoides bicaudatus]|nr:hypothetical protein M3Y97_00007200 [Aphelenchoides bicaudatus]